MWNEIKLEHSCIYRTHKQLICEKVCALWKFPVVSFSTVLFMCSLHCAYLISMRGWVLQNVLQMSRLVLLQSVVLCLVVHAAERDPSAGERGHCTGQGAGSERGRHTNTRFLQRLQDSSIALFCSSLLYLLSCTS